MLCPKNPQSTLLSWVRIWVKEYFQRDRHRECIWDFFDLGTVISTRDVELPGVCLYAPLIKIYQPAPLYGGEMYE